MEIDLHGYNSLDDANKKDISIYISECYEKNVKSINIITGKGLRSKNSKILINLQIYRFLKILFLII